MTGLLDRWMERRLEEHMTLSSRVVRALRAQNNTTPEERMQQFRADRFTGRLAPHRMAEAAVELTPVTPTPDEEDRR